MASAANTGSKDTPGVTSNQATKVVSAKASPAKPGASIPQTTPQTAPAMPSRDLPVTSLANVLATTQPQPTPRVKVTKPPVAPTVTTTNSVAREIDPTPGVSVAEKASAATPANEITSEVAQAPTVTAKSSVIDLTSGVAIVDSLSTPGVSDAQTVNSATLVCDINVLYAFITYLIGRHAFCLRLIGQ